jgi:hypothetical protein
MWKDLSFSALEVSRLKILVAMLLVSCLPALGVLGGDASSIASDQAHLKASVRVIVRSSYSVHEMLTPTGTTVRQFVSPSGTVFGVSWQGFAPDLQQLLGEHFQEYLAAVDSESGRRGRGVHIDTGDLVLDSGGHMRFVVGRAFLRSQLPSGVSADVVQ